MDIQRFFILGYSLDIPITEVPGTAHDISQRFVRRIWDPRGRKVSRSKTPRQAFGIIYATFPDRSATYASTLGAVTS